MGKYLNKATEGKKVLVWLMAQGEVSHTRKDTCQDVMSSTGDIESEARKQGKSNSNDPLVSYILYSLVFQPVSEKPPQKA